MAGWRVAAAVGIALAAVAPPLLARTLVHEPVPFAPGERDPAPITAQPAKALAGSSPQDGLPGAIDYNGETIPAPSADASPRDGEPVLKPSEAPSDEPEASPSPLAPDGPSSYQPTASGSGGAAGSGTAGSGTPGSGAPGSEGPSSATPGSPGPSPDGPPAPTRSRELRPDGDTGADPVLKYASVFRPSVAPFKRFDVKDAVAADFTLRIREPRLRRLPIGGPPEVGRERFFGSVVVAASDGASIPIPSVAADARILRVETSPRQRRVRFLRDGAGNDYLELSGGGAVGEGTVRVNWLTDAPRRYFGGALPRTRLRDVPPSLRPMVPENVRTAALAVLARLKIPFAPGTPVEDALAPLVAHFRAFRADERRLRERGAALFSVLALGGRGACRHRAYAFTILAQTLGLPTRYVANEAHAFAESWLPGAGWRRLDLGGVSPELQVYGRERVPHRPPADPFARPDAYRSAYSVPPEPPPSLPAANPSDGPDAASGASGSYSSEAASGANAAAAPSPAAAPSAAPPTPVGPAPTRIEVQVAERDALRGDALTVEGRIVTAAGAPAASVRVDLVLHEPEGGTGRRRVGVLVTDEGGRFTARLPLPSDLSAGRYNLVVSTPGDEHYQPATTD